MSYPNDIAPQAALTKELLARCQNEGLVSYAGLLKDKPDVAAAIAAHPQHRQRYIVWCNAKPEWVKTTDTTEPPCATPTLVGIYRLNPNAPTQRNFWDGTDVKVDRNGFVFVRLRSGYYSCVASCLANKDYIGIWYEKDGVKTLHADLNLPAYGMVVGVRFAED